MKPLTLVIGAALESISKNVIPAKLVLESNRGARRGMAICAALFFVLGCASVPSQKMDEKMVQDKKGAAVVNAPRVISSIANEKEKFRVGAHTKLFISVYDEPDLTDEIVVLPDGSIDYTYVGKIVVKGLTVKEVEDKLTQLLEKDYLVHPQVKVKVVEWGMVYVFGKVKNPGILKLTEQQTALQAVAAVGGFSEGAQRKVIQVVRLINEEKRIFTLSLRETENKGLDLTESLYLLPDDTLVVE